jgi:glycogen operon protein
MLLMGDEMRRTQRGNNNAYCHDSELVWLDWSLLERHADVHRFVTRLAAVRQRRDVVSERHTPTLCDLLRRVRIEWHGVRRGAPDWGERSRSLAMSMRSLHDRRSLYAIFNAYREPLTFELPPPPAGRPWRRCIDTALASPDDIHDLIEAPILQQDAYAAEPRSVVLLAAALGVDDGA